MDQFETDLLAIVGERGLLRGADAEPHCTDWRGLHRGRARAVVRPSSTLEVSRVVALCAAHGVPIVPQGGNTGLAGGATPSARGDAVVLLTGRLNRILEASPADATLTVQAGVTLAAARAAAAEMGLMFPLSIGSEGSAQIGGVLSTNAGGSGTARYGNARDLALGLEVVLPDGQVWNGLRKLRKDNSGYCLRHLLMGAEGTLGIITAAVLKLVPAPARITTAFCTVDSVRQALDLQQALRAATGSELHTFEYMSRSGLEMVSRHMPNTRLPVVAADHHLLIELASSSRTPDADELEEVLSPLFERGLLTDAAIAGSEAARADFRRLRESFAEAQLRQGAHVKCDVSVPVSKVPDFIDATSSVCAREFPGSVLVCVSHLGDGNVHCNLHCPAGMEPTAFLSRRNDVAAVIDGLAMELGGSFSAEHGIGGEKLEDMRRWKDGVELELMKILKRGIDPSGILNPGKIFQ